MYNVVMYGLMASPPTKAHQAILEKLLAETAAKNTPVTFAYHGGQCTYSYQNESSETVTRSISFSGSDRANLERQIKKDLAKQNLINYTEILCVPSADGPAVLGKSPSAVDTHRLAMMEIAANDVMERTGDHRIVVSDIEMALSKLIGLPSYTANTLIILKEGLNGLLSKTPLENYLLTPQERKEKTAEEKAVLVHERKGKIESYLANYSTNPHEFLTPDGLKLATELPVGIDLSMGLDSFNSLDRWNNPDDIVGQADALTVFTREGNTSKLDTCISSSEADKASLSEFYKKTSGKTKRLSTDLDPSIDYSAYSSTKIREQMAKDAVYLVGDADRKSWVCPGVLGYIQRNELYQAPAQPVVPFSPVVSVITDSEGNDEYFQKSAEMNDALIERLQFEGSIGEHHTRIKAFLGDACDKGTGDLKTLKAIKDGVARGENWLLIGGNRDDNKIRLLELLNVNYINRFTSEKKTPYWAPKAQTPAEFFGSLGLVGRSYEDLSINEKRVIVLKWMFAQTMGAPNAFNDRRTSLQELLGRSISEEEIMQSFIEEILKPEEFETAAGFEGLRHLGFNTPSHRVLPQEYQGINRWYIDNSHSMAVIDGTFYSHAGLPEGVFPYLQSGQALFDPAIPANPESFKTWVNSRNAERQANNRDYIARALGADIHGIITDPAVQASLPKDAERPYNTQSFDSFSGKYDTETLEQCGIFRSVHGHQMALTETPRMIRSDSSKVLVVNADTRLGTPSFKQFPNATIIAAGQIHCLSKNVEGQSFRSDSRDRRIGTVFPYPINGHQYTIIGKIEDSELSKAITSHEETKGEMDEASKIISQKTPKDPVYLLVCYKKDGPFFSVGPSHGKILQTNSDLNLISFDITLKERGLLNVSSSSKEPEQKITRTGSFAFFSTKDEVSKNVAPSFTPPRVRVKSL